MLIGDLFQHWTYKIFLPGTALRKKYEAFKSLLNYDKKAHELMAELEEIYHNQIKVDFKAIEKTYHALSRSISGLIENFSHMCPSCHPDLKDYFKKLDGYIRFIFKPETYDFSPPYTLPLNEATPDDHLLVGGKAPNLSVMKRNLQLPVPKGFVITTRAFNFFIEFNKLREPIDERLSSIDINSPAGLSTASTELTDLIMNAQIPSEIQKEILEACHSLQASTGRKMRLAVRSSAVSEDMRSSFAGQYRTVLNVTGDGVLDAYKAVIASKYTPRALYYRINYGLLDMETPMAVIVLEMIDAAVSGVMYTEDIEGSAPNRIAIHAIWGLGELLVGGKVSPDIIGVEKSEEIRITQKKIGVKSKQMAFSNHNTTKIIPVDEDKKNLPSLDDKTALVLSEWGIRIEKHFKEPQDIEWCMDKAGNLFLLQSRPLRLEETSSGPVECNFEEIENKVLVQGGESACSGIGAGEVFKIESDVDLEELPEGAVLVARNASPHYVTVMNKLSAVVTDMGSTAGHFSSVAREFGVPTLVNTGFATTHLTHGKAVTVYAEGKVVYEGVIQSMLESPCAKKNLLEDSPFSRKLKYIIDFISPLRLTDPQDKLFVPGQSRSLHDILRFTHEKAVQEMFQIGSRRIRKLPGSHKLLSDIPMFFYVVDVGEGLKQESVGKKSVHIDDIVSMPMKALFKGLSHPGIRWSSFSHFDWAEYDKIVMSGGIISPESAMFASYAVLSNDYLNLNLRFGYHFVILDTICGDQPKDNYILFRFAGGGADFEKRTLRADFLRGVLQRLGYKVNKKSDLIDGELKEGDRQTIEHTLDITGRLLGATRLMDMYLKDGEMVESYIEEFLNGRYHFASVES